MRRIGLLLFLLLVFILEACKPSHKGGTDPSANTLELEARENDGSFTYDEAWLSPVKSMALSASVKESSGLLFWEGRLLTHNDNTDTGIYAVDTATGSAEEEYLLEGVENINWEEMAQDSEYLYLGDFGNNASGNREDLHILRIHKAELKAGRQSIDTICFSYSDQHDLSPAGPNQTEFDCEALVVSSNGLYLFTKQWLSGHTTVYALPKEPGKYVAQKQSSFDIKGLVSGAAYFESKHLLVLCGYTGVLQAFLYLFYDFQGDDFFSGNKRRVNISIPFLQVEGIASMDALTYYVSNESYVKEALTNTPQQVHIIDLSPYLAEHLNGVK